VKPTIVIIDYQMGNLRSVQKAIETTGNNAIVTSDPELVATAEKIILPGVGAFADAIREPIVDAIRQGKPFLGICLGLQLLFDFSDEGGKHIGLGVIPGAVRRFSGSAFVGENGLKVPHMGWNQVVPTQEDCPLMAGLAPMEYFYFVHSYYVQPERSELSWLATDYGGSFCAAIWRENLFATQFHPEKSQEAGLQLLKNFAEL